MNLDKFKACVLGVAIGDALGMPFETMTAHDIRNRIGRVRGFESPSSNPYIFSSLRHLSNGSWTDDTQRTLAIIEAFIESQGIFDMNIIAEKHISIFRKKAYPYEMRGWGKSSRNSLSRLSSGISWKDSGEPGGAGNGVMMSIAPLGLRQSVVPESMRTFVEQCIEYAKMTHLGTPAIVGGVVHALAVASLAGHSYAPLTQHYLSSFLYFLYRVAIELEERFPLCRDKISSQIRKVMEYMEYGKRGRLSEQNSDRVVALFGGGTSYACHSFGLSYVIFLRSVLGPDNLNSFNAVFDAVNAGGDTDSNASIVGSLVGALRGMRAIPWELVRGLEKNKMIRKRTEKFFEACKASSAN